MTAPRSTNPSPRSGVAAPRALSRRSAIAAAGGGLAGGLVLPAGSSSSQGSAGDRDALEPVLAVEELLSSLYRFGLERFDAAAFAAAGSPDGLRRDLVAIEAQEQEHLAAVTGALAGGGLAHGPAVAADGLSAFLETAADAENLAVAAYAGAAAAVGGRRLRRTLLGIHSVEARHAAYLAALLGRPAFPDAVDTPAGRNAVLAAVARFGGSTGSSATPAAASPASPAAGADDPRFRDLLDDAAARFGVSRDEVSVERVEAHDWLDASLGCPEPGGVYAQVVTPGYLVVVAAGGEELAYHTDDRGTFVSC